MKQSYLLYKNSLYISVSTICLLSLLASCFLKERPDSSSRGEGSGIPLLNEARNLFQACQVYQSVLRTPLSEVPIRARLNRETQSVELEIADSKPVSFNVPLPPTDQFCKGEESTVSLVMDLLGKSIPACRIYFEDDKFFCTMQADPALASAKKIHALKSAMLKKSQRPAYLFSRRLALAENLASLLRKPDWQNRLDSFCAVVQSSLPEELPLIFTVEAWRKKVCTTEDEDQSLSLALLALSKAVEELTVLAELRDEVTANGILSVRLPRAALEGTRMTVHLEASPETKSLLLTELKHTFSGTADGTASHVCWFPGMKANELIFEIARLMGILGHHDEAPCQAPEETAYEELASYFLANLTAETRFTVTNGLAKILTLPQGQYEYSIYSVPDEISAEMDSKLVDKGALSWTKQRRFLTIAKSPTP
ncbi:MAG: hypothetical protein HYW48_08470 [Deltaproteobacteria bacterium]|nr:hypothetical protein [Deltaproteobacteria bacterium]